MFNRNTKVLIQAPYKYRGMHGLIESGKIKQEIPVYEVAVLKVDIDTEKVTIIDKIELLQNQFTALKKLTEEERNELLAEKPKTKRSRTKKEEVKQEVVETQTVLKMAKNSDNQEENIELKLVELENNDEFNSRYDFIKTMFSFEELQEVARRIATDVDGYLNDLEILKAKYGFKI